MPNLSGKTINKRYKVIESIGRGGMAEVYKVWDAQRQEHLAAKVLRQDLAHDLIFLKRFEREARTLAKLQHPNIVRFYGLEQDDMLVMMLMDYIEGESLRELIFRNRGKGFGSAEITRVIQPIATALHYAHQQGVVHCDLKPGNILIDKTGKVYISDFGIARHVDAATMTLIGVGTPAYMAPELVSGREPSPRSDIYALGIILYEMATGGQRPFTGDGAKVTGTTAEKVRWEQLNTTPKLPRGTNRKVITQLEAVIYACLQKDPNHRPTTTLEVMEAIKGGKVSSGLAQSKQKEKTQAKEKETARDKKSYPKKKGKAPLWRRWYVWAGLAVAAVVLLLTQITLPPLEIPAPPTDTSPATAVPTRTPLPTLTPTSVFGIGSEEVSEKDGMTLLYVPAGEFLRGSTENDKYAYSDEFPQRSIYLDAFWIDQTEVTNIMYKQCVENGDCDPPNNTNYYNDNDYSSHPIVYVSWYDAEDYCQWAGRRLPTEAEWEKAARGEDGLVYPWGDTFINSLHNVNNNNTIPVGSFSANASPYGALDMASNVWEWVWDWYDGKYYDNDQSPRENPFNTNEKRGKIIRGGGWYSNEGFGRSALRNYYGPNNIYYYLGFRCALSL